ncbi:hypothetical protein SODG_005800 [Sodalis praecaptivus]
MRQELPLRHPQLTQLIGDIDTLPAQADALAAQDVFIALGTTRKNSPCWRRGWPSNRARVRYRWCQRWARASALTRRICVLKGKRNGILLPYARRRRIFFSPA